MSLEVKYIDAPPGAQQNMAVSADNGNAVSAPELLPFGASESAWATLETYGWPLDGSRDLIPEAPSVGFWSGKATDERAGILGINRLGRILLNKAEGTAEFETRPVIFLQFSESITATGITFVFAVATGEWCSEISVRWYNGQTLLAEETVFPNAARWTLLKFVEGFDRIRIELLRTSKPGHFAKLRMIEIGQTILFDREELTAVHLVNEIDPTLSKLTVDTMTVDIQDKHNRVLYPQENQKMELFRNGKLVATHYITESTRKSRGGYSFSCQSAIGLLEDTFLGGLYSSTPVKTVVEEILDGRAYDLGAFSDLTITGYLPVCTRREALQQVAFAIGAVITTQGTDVVRFCCLPENGSGIFNKSKVFAGGGVKSSPRFYKIEIDAHSYAPSDTVETLVNNEEFSGDDILLTFDAPHHSYSITGGTVKESGANWVNICADGRVTLTAKTYLHSTLRHTRRNALATAAERNNLQTIDSATLVHCGNVKGVLDRLFSFAQLRQTMTQEAVIDTQYAGQMVSMEDAWGEMIQGYISAMESDLTQGGHTATVTIIGRRHQPVPVYGYSGEICAGNTEVVYG